MIYRSPVRHPFFDLPLPIVIGHRGSSGEAPENTLPAFARALEQGAAVLETDVHATRDGVVVVYHDERVDRTTDGEGAIAELEFAALRRLDAGHAFSPDGGRSFPWRGRGLRVATLAEAFEACPGARFNVELKTAEPALVEGTLEAVRAAGRAARTLLTAGEDAAMACLRRRLRETGLATAVGASSGDVVGFVRAAAAGSAPPAEPMALQIPTTFAGRPLVTRELVEFAHGHDVQVHVWTVNEPAEMHALLDLGVDGLVSDFPARMCEVLRERGVRR
jgi:glycerophosphoryl diester phosphodiesterase